MLLPVLHWQPLPPPTGSLHIREWTPRPTDSAGYSPPRRGPFLNYFGQTCFQFIARQLNSLPHGQRTILVIVPLEHERHYTYLATATGYNETWFSELKYFPGRRPRGQNSNWEENRITSSESADNIYFLIWRTKMIRERERKRKRLSAKQMYTNDMLRTVVIDLLYNDRNLILFS